MCRLFTHSSFLLDDLVSNCSCPGPDLKTRTGTGQSQLERRSKHDYGERPLKID